MSSKVNDLTSKSAGACTKLCHVSRSALAVGQNVRYVRIRKGTPVIHSDLVPNEWKRMCEMPITTKTTNQWDRSQPNAFYPTAPIMSQTTSNFKNHARGEQKNIKSKTNVTLHCSFSVNDSSFLIKLRKIRELTQSSSETKNMAYCMMPLTLFLIGQLSMVQRLH